MGLGYVVLYGVEYIQTSINSYSMISVFTIAKNVTSLYTHDCFTQNTKLITNGADTTTIPLLLILVHSVFIE